MHCPSLTAASVSLVMKWSCWEQRLTCSANEHSLCCLGSQLGKAIRTVRGWLIAPWGSESEFNGARATMAYICSHEVPWE